MKELKTNKYIYLIIVQYYYNTPLMVTDIMGDWEEYNDQLHHLLHPRKYVQQNKIPIILSSNLRSLKVKQTDHETDMIWNTFWGKEKRKGKET